MLRNTLRTPIASRIRSETSRPKIHELCSLQPTASIKWARWEALTDYTLLIQV
jgi:hypothetical protein